MTEDAYKALQTFASVVWIYLLGSKLTLPHISTMFWKARSPSHPEKGPDSAPSPGAQQPATHTHLR